MLALISKVKKEKKKKKRKRQRRRRRNSCMKKKMHLKCMIISYAGKGVFDTLINNKNKFLKEKNFKKIKRIRSFYAA